MNQSRNASKKPRFGLLAIALLGLYGCGGGGYGGGSSSAPAYTAPSTTTSSASTITSYLVDGPAKGLSYACSPSGLSGLTSSTGSFTCQTGDTVAFSLNVGASTIAFGSVAVPGTSGVSVPVTMFANGLQVAEVLQALNHGSSTDIDVSGLTIPAAVVAEINSYISSGGTLPPGQSSDDQFLASIQSQTTGATTSFVTPVTGSGDTFRQNTVLPNLQTTVTAISATNPAPMLTSNSTTKLSGTILVSGSGTIPATGGCTSATWSASGGGILNATVNGNIQKAGVYPVSFSSPGFQETISVSSMTCTSGTVTTTIPASTTTSSVPPFAANDTITVTAAFSGNALALASNSAPPAGCTGGAVTGTDVGASNPLITMSTAVTCAAQSASFTVSATAKLVGAW
ncbi:MAG: hypothetical protein ACYC7B_07070 [Burkholderiales bacterium]